MEPYFRYVVLELYLLLKGSRFESAGFALPTIAPTTLHAQLTEGVRAYRATILRVATPAAGSIEATPAESTMIAGSSQPF